MAKTLLPEHESKIEELVARGGFNDADRAIQEAILLLEERVSQDELLSLLTIGDEQYERGESIEVTEAWFAERRARAQARVQAGEQPNPDGPI